MRQGTKFEAAVRLLDAGTCRLPLVFLAALAAWAAFLVGMERAMRTPHPDAPVPRPMSVQLVEIAPPPADGPRVTVAVPGPQAPTPTPIPAPAPTPTPAPLPMPPRPQASNPPPSQLPAPMPTPVLAPTRPADAAPPHDVQPRRLEPERHAARHEPARPAVTRPARPRRAIAAPAPAAAPPSPMPAPSSATLPGDRGIARDSPARPLARPLPTLPDDLRENALRAVALARFLIHADGSVKVTLLKPTPNPRLNRLLLEALGKWRFSPAMKDGKATESSQDIRVHFNVD